MQLVCTGIHSGHRRTTPMHQAAAQALAVSLLVVRLTQTQHQAHLPTFLHHSSLHGQRAACVLMAGLATMQANIQLQVVHHQVHA